MHEVKKTALKNNMKDMVTNDKIVTALKKSIDTLVLLELCKLDASAKEIRNILGSLDNNQFSAINAVIKGEKKHGQ